MIVIKHKGGFENTEKFLKRMSKTEIYRCLDKYGQQGVDALSSATPIKTGLTAESWNYEIRKSKGSFSIVWTNSNVVNGVPIAIILEYGHGTGTGGYVQGRNFINPAIQPIFDRMAEEVWKEVTAK